MRRTLIPGLGGFCALCILLARARAGEPRRSIDVSRVLDAGAASSVAPAIAFDRTQPDPVPLAERRQWLFDLRWDRGDVRMAGVHQVELAGPQATPRVMGRFALELYEGAALVERLRFDFPLLAVPDAHDGGWSGVPALTPKLRTRVQVSFPAISRGTRLELVDRASNRRWPLGWPPDAPDPDGGH